MYVYVASKPFENKQVKHDEAASDDRASERRSALHQSSPKTNGKIIERREKDPGSSNETRERRSQENRRKQQAKTTDEQLSVRKDMKLQQHRRKILLAGCEPVMGFNYDCLAMDAYPSNALVAGARRDRDYWLVLCGLFGTTFILGVFGLVSAWFAGIGCGLFLLSLVFAFTSLRKLFFERPPLHELLNARKKIEFSALNHLHFLEGESGLAWRCEKLAKYNSNLKRNIFHGLFRYSKERHLLRIIKNKKHIRLYLLLMIESQKAYKRLQKDYLALHFKHMDQGWDDTISSAEAAKLEQMAGANESVESPSANS